MKQINFIDEIIVDCFAGGGDRCGNAVPPPFAVPLVRANWPELCEGKNIRTMQELKENITA